jgi:hypothetical protein
MMAPLINSSRGPAEKKEKTKMRLVKILENAAAMDGMDLFFKKLIILTRFC